MITLTCSFLVFWDVRQFITRVSGNTLTVIEIPLSMRCLDFATKMTGLETKILGLVLKLTIP